MATLSRPEECDTGNPSTIEVPALEAQKKPTFLHRGQLVIENAGSTTRDYLGQSFKQSNPSNHILRCAMLFGLTSVRKELSCMGQIGRDMYRHFWSPSYPTSSERDKQSSHCIN